MFQSDAPSTHRRSALVSDQNIPAWLHVSCDPQDCRVYTRTHVARKHVSRTSNLYTDTYMLTDTSWSSGIHVDSISAKQLLFIYVAVDLYPFVSSNRRTTNWRQFCRRYRYMSTATSGYMWIQLVSGNMYPSVNVALGKHSEHLLWCVDS